MSHPLLKSFWQVNQQSKTTTVTRNVFFSILSYPPSAHKHPSDSYTLVVSTTQHSKVLFILLGDSSQPSISSKPTHIERIKWDFLGEAFHFPLKLGCPVLIPHCTLYVSFMFQFVVLFLHILAIYNAAVIFIIVSLMEDTQG